MSVSLAVSNPVWAYHIAHNRRRSLPWPLASVRSQVCLSELTLLPCWGVFILQSGIFAPGKRYVGLSQFICSCHLGTASTILTHSQNWYHEMVFLTSICVAHSWCLQPECICSRPVPAHVLPFAEWHQQLGIDVPETLCSMMIIMEPARQMWQIWQRCNTVESRAT